MNVSLRVSHSVCASLYQSAPLTVPLHVCPTPISHSGVWFPGPPLEEVRKVRTLWFLKFSGNLALVKRKTFFKNPYHSRLTHHHRASMSLPLRVYVNHLSKITTLSSVLIILGCSFTHPQYFLCLSNHVSSNEPRCLRQGRLFLYPHLSTISTTLPEAINL